MAAAVAALAVLAGLVLALLWRDRPEPEDIGWPSAEVVSTVTQVSVSVTWLGVSTLLFDDGDTQLLIDGFFSRPSLTDMLFERPVNNDAAAINFAMNEYRMRRLAAIIPAHSHFDHAMDVGEIANRSSASVLGSESTANIARGAGVPEDQIIVAIENETYTFGRFDITLRAAPHAPIAWRGAVPFPGTVDEPLTLPQPVSAMRMGGAWSIVVAHPDGTALIQASAGFDKYRLLDIEADVVFLGVAQLNRLGRDYTNLFWQHTVNAVGAHTVYPVHFDDYSQPFGTIRLPPRVIDDFEKTAEWLERIRDRWGRDTVLRMPQFGTPLAVFTVPARRED